MRNVYYRVFDGDWEAVSFKFRSSWDPFRGRQALGPLLEGLSLETEDWTTRLEREERAGSGFQCAGQGDPGVSERGGSATARSLVGDLAGAGSGLRAVLSGGTDAIPLLRDALHDVAETGGDLRRIAGSQAHLIAEPSELAGAAGSPVGAANGPSGQMRL